MSLEATPLLQDEEEGVENEEKIDFKQMVWFHGKVSEHTHAWMCSDPLEWWIQYSIQGIPWVWLQV